MEGLLRKKFSDPSLKNLLDNTKGIELVEGNTWKDTFWGVYNGNGKNMLGKLLMKIRDTINNQNYIVNLLDRINQNLNTNISGITLKVIENTELDGIKLTGDMKKYEKTSHASPSNENN